MISLVAFLLGLIAIIKVQGNYGVNSTKMIGDAATPWRFSLVCDQHNNLTLSSGNKRLVLCFMFYSMTAGINSIVFELLIRVVTVIFCSLVFAFIISRNGNGANINVINHPVIPDHMNAEATADDAIVVDDTLLSDPVTTQDDCISEDGIGGCGVMVIDTNRRNVTNDLAISDDSEDFNAETAMDSINNESTTDVNDDMASVNDFSHGAGDIYDDFNDYKQLFAIYDGIHTITPSPVQLAFSTPAKQVFYQSSQVLVAILPQTGRAIVVVNTPILRVSIQNELYMGETIAFQI